MPKSRALIYYFAPASHARKCAQEHLYKYQRQVALRAGLTIPSRIFTYQLTDKTSADISSFLEILLYLDNKQVHMNKLLSMM